MSVSTTLIMFTVFAVLCWLLTQKARWHTVKAIGIGCALVTLRFLLPVEFPGAKIIALYGDSTKPFYWLKHTTVWHFSILQWLGIIWLIGAAGFLLALVFRLCHQSKLTRSMAETGDSRLQSLFTSSSDALGIAKKGKLIVSGPFTSPMMIGFCKPYVLLPEAMVHEEDAALHYVFLHELTHFKKRDLWIKLALEILCCLLWWNPAAYLLRSCVDQLLELRCDSFVCKDFTPEETTEYSEVLLNVVKQSKVPKSLVIAGHFGYSGDKRIRQRFGQLLTSPGKKRPFASALIIAVALVCFTFTYSHTIQLRNAPRSLYSLTVNQETDFILRYPDGTLELYKDHHLYAELRSSVLEEEPFCYLAVYDVNISYD